MSKAKGLNISLPELEIFYPKNTYLFIWNRSKTILVTLEQGCFL